MTNIEHFDNATGHHYAFTVGIDDDVDLIAVQINQGDKPRVIHLELEDAQRLMNHLKDLIVEAAL